MATWGRIQGNNKERRKDHPNQVPEVYLERVIRACSNESDLVLDPFLGSGTTCTVARALRRRSIGIVM
jgi:adenine-specific DNA-methyltransferase